MPPDAQHPGSPEDWMRYAKADLALARVPLAKGGMYVSCPTGSGKEPQSGSDSLWS
jgi:hypothetical protein